MIIVGSKEWLDAKSKGPLHEYEDSRGMMHRGYMGTYHDFGGTDHVAEMYDRETGEMNCVSGSRLRNMRIVRQSI